MAKIRFKTSDVEKYLKIDEKTIEKINLFGTPAEKIGDELEIEVFPNRPDLISLQGFVRAINAFTGKRSGIPEYKVISSQYVLKAEKTLPTEWPYAYACIVKGLSLDDQKIREIIQIQEKLGSTLLRNRKKGGLGLYPLDKVSFPVTFKGMSPEKIKFRPLEYPKEINARQILASHPTGKEYAHIIEKWKTFPVFVDSNNLIMSMPPIINSHALGKIDESTRDVFVECTGNDRHAVTLALTILVTSLADMGGKIHSIECIQQDGTKEKIPSFTKKTYSLSIDNVNKLLGTKLKEKDIEEACSKMQLQYANKKVHVPSWRNDILHEVDLIEDIAIGHGYELLEPESPSIATIGEEDPKSIINKKCVETLIGLGFLETSSLHFITTDEAKKINLKKPLSVESSRTEYKILRPSLLPALLRTYSENTDAEYPQKLSEIGTVFKEDPSAETGISEASHLIFALAPGNYTSIKQILDSLNSSLGISCSLTETTQENLIPGRCASISIDKKIIGHMGEVHPDMLADWKIKMPLAIAEIDLNEIYKKVLNN